MRKVWIIAVREYKSAVYTKAFLISLALMPLMMGGSLIAQYFLEGMKDTKERKFAVIDRTPGRKMVPILKLALGQRNKLMTTDAETGKRIEADYAIVDIEPSDTTPEAMLRQRFELSERVRSKELSGFLEIGKDVLKPPTLSVGAAISAIFNMPIKPPSKENAEPKEGKTNKLKLNEIMNKLPDGIVVRYQTNNQMNTEFPSWSIAVLNVAIQAQRATEAKLPAQQVLALVQPVGLATKELAKINKATGQLEDGRESNFLVSFFIPLGIVMLMFMTVMIGATPLLHGVIEEKIQRIAEVLLGSVSPFQLMLGKLIGVVGVSLTLSAVYLGGAYWAAQRYGYMEYLPASLIWWFLLFQTLAVLMFGAAFIAVGAACSDIKEAQTLMTPVTLVLVFPMMVIGNVIKEPDSKLSVIMSFFPPSTPLLMTVRQSVPPGVPLWQPIVGVIGTLLTTALLVWAAGRIFRIGLLMQGKAPSIRELISWVFTG